MGQKSNTTTIRVNLRKNLSFLNQTKDSKVFQFGFNYLNFLEFFLNKKNILVTSKELNLNGNLLYLNLTIFYYHVKLAGYKKKRQRIRFGSKNSNNPGFEFHRGIRLLTNKFMFFRNNLTLIHLKVLNIEVNKSFLKELYLRIAKVLSVLFVRKFNLFLDFLKICSLFYQKKIPGSLVLYVLGQVFKVLPKKKHNRFLFFLKQILEIFIEMSKDNSFSSTNQILGLKFIVSGRLRGKPRGSWSCIQVGAVPIQSIERNIEFSKLHVHTLYGVFGFKMWVHRN